MQNMRPTVDVIIPTYKPDGRLSILIHRLMRQTYPVNKIIIVNTENSKADKKQLCQNEAVEVHHVPIEDFNHGLTRNYARDFSEAEYVVFVTQDVVPKDCRLIEELMRPFEDPDVYVSYARQIPRKDSSPMESYTRKYNYPDYDIVKTIDDVEKMGIKAFFSSDVCAAYRRREHILMGGFPKTILNEDAIYAARVILDGKKVYYCSRAKVIHSHNYTYRQQFRRNFDIGVSHRDYELIFSCTTSEQEGIKLVINTAKHLVCIGKWYLIPDLIMHSGFKFLGYRLGKRYKSLPKSLILKCTSMKSYWK